MPAYLKRDAPPRSYNTERAENKLLRSRDIEITNIHCRLRTPVPIPGAEAVFHKSRFGTCSIFHTVLIISNNCRRTVVRYRVRDLDRVGEKENRSGRGVQTGSSAQKAAVIGR